MPNLSEQDVISFKDFQHLPDEAIKIGMKVGPINVDKLYASQTWSDEEKFRTALMKISEQIEPLVAPLYVHRLQFKDGRTHRILVLGYLHHRTLVWSVNRLDVYGEIVATSLPDRLIKNGKEIIPFSRFKRMHQSEIASL
jgi:hypothetical protein